MKNSKLLRYITVAALVLVIAVGGTAAVLAYTNQADVIFHYAGENSYFKFSDAVTTTINDDTTTVSVFNIQNFMPGDSFEKTLNVKVENVSGKNINVNIYLTVEIPTEGNENTKTTVKTPDGYTYDANTLLLTLLDASYNGEKLNQPQDKLFIGSFTSDAQKKTVDISFALPLDAGNEYQGLFTAVDWVFIAEYSELPPPPPDEPYVPQLKTDEHFAYIIGDTDGLVRPEANISRAEVVTILFRCLTDESRAYFWSTENPFSDVKQTNWYNNAVSTLCNAGIINGLPDGTFRPNDPITRAEYATMLARFYKIEHSDDVTFSDIEGHWAQEYIVSGAANGYINGDPDGRFRPDEPITRAEAMALTNRVLGRKADRDHLLDGMIKWPDNADTTKWYYADVQEATNSHDCEYVETATTRYEVWTKLVPNKDWVALEREWSMANDENHKTVKSNKQ